MTFNKTILMSPNKSLDFLITNLLLINLCGFLMIGVLPNLFGFETESLTVFYRALILIFSLILVIIVFINKKSYVINKNKIKLFFLFWFIYSARIIYDVFIFPINIGNYNEVTYYLQFAFGVILLPSICLVFLISNSNVNFKYILKWLQHIIFVTLLLALYYRNNDVFQGRSAGNLNIGILLFGQYGASLIIVNVYSLIFDKNNFFKIIYFLLGIIVGLLSIVISASKSPFLAVLLVLLFLVFYRYGFIRGVIITLIAISVLFFSFFSFFGYLSDTFNSDFLFRVMYSLDNGDEARNKLLTSAIDDFLSNPIFGNSFLIQKKGFEGSYPHNLIIESFMATGIFGGFVFLKLLINNLKSIIKNNNNLLWIGLLFIQYLLFGMFSGNLYSSHMFWLLSIILLVRGDTKKIKIT